MQSTSFGLLEEEAFAWTARWATLEPQPAYVDPSHRWRIRSSLQKATRRGQGDRAVRMGLALHRLDPRYAWRSILTVAVEDVGVGCPEVVLWATAAQRSGFRKSVGELPLLIGLIRRMAAAIKSRSAIELAFVVETGEPKIFELFSRMTTGELLRRFEDDDPYEAFAAVSVLRGVVPTGYRLRPPDRRGVQAVLETLGDLADQTMACAASAALLHPLDNMSLGFLTVAHLAGSHRLRHDEMPPGRMIDGYPAETFDQHERLGRQAIALFSRQGRGQPPALTRLTPSRRQRVVADAVFVAEGQCLDQWRGGEDFDRLRSEADRFTMTRHGLGATDGTEIVMWIRSRLEDLHSIRAEIVRDAS